MKRFTYPKFIDCKPPSNVVKISNDVYKLSIDLKKAFHHTYVDTHNRPPRLGTNPIFDEYEQLLDNSDELRFQSSGIADDTESKVRESGKLGRGIARYILSEYYGYTWFGKIQNLLSSSYEGWKVERPKDGGNTPDWLISDGNSQFCIGEAKGTHSHMEMNSKKVQDWRKQSTNIVVKQNNNSKKLKSWLIATRFVTDKTTDLPEQLIYDPFTEGDMLNDNEYPSLNRLIVRNHLSNTLYRISNFQLGLRVQEEASIENYKNQIMTWKPIIKELNHLSFIGKPIGGIGNNSWFWKEFYHLRNHPDIWNEFITF